MKKNSLVVQWWATALLSRLASVPQCIAALQYSLLLSLFALKAERFSLFNKLQQKKYSRYFFAGDKLYRDAGGATWARQAMLGS